MDPAWPRRNTQIDLGLVSRLNSTNHLQGTREPVNPSRSTSKTIKRAKGDPESAVSQDLVLVKVTELRIRPHEYIEPINSSPWEAYEKIFQLPLNTTDRITVAEIKGKTSKAIQSDKNPLANLVLVKSISGSDAQEKLRMIQKIRHPNFVLPIEIYLSDGCFYVVSEYMAFPLCNVATNPHLNDLRLAAILGQVSHGFYLWHG